MNFLRAYLEAIKILKTERDYSIKALAQFTRVQNLKAIAEGYDYFINQLATGALSIGGSYASGRRADRRDQSQSDAGSTRRATSTPAI